VSTRRLLKYLSYALILLGYAVATSILLYEIKMEGSKSYQYTTFWIAHFFTYVFVGVLLGLSVASCQWKKTGKWKINAEKLLCLGLPALFFASIYLNYGYLSHLPILARFAGRVISMGAGFIEIAQAVFGYVLVTSFYRQ